MMSAADLFAAVVALPRRPEAVQALWDGDSSGWMVCIQAVYACGPSYGTESIAVLRGGGGDMRIFNDAVPPWPEAKIASEAGLMIESRLKIPFFFPSPAGPEDTCPNWWERHLGKLCRTCSKLLLQEDTLPWFGQCYECYLNNDPPTPKNA